MADLRRPSREGALTWKRRHLHISRMSACGSDIIWRVEDVEVSGLQPHRTTRLSSCIQVPFCLYNNTCMQILSGDVKIAADFHCDQPCCMLTFLSFVSVSSPAVQTLIISPPDCCLHLHQVTLFLSAVHLYDRPHSESSVPLGAGTSALGVTP